MLQVTAKNFHLSNNLIGSLHIWDFSFISNTGNAIAKLRFVKEGDVGLISMVDMNTCLCRTMEFSAELPELAPTNLSPKLEILKLNEQGEHGTN